MPSKHLWRLQDIDEKHFTNESITILKNVSIYVGIGFEIQNPYYS